jgi:hypothetical protein
VFARTISPLIHPETHALIKGLPHMIPSEVFRLLGVNFCTNGARFHLVKAVLTRDEKFPPVVSDAPWSQLGK